MNEDSVIWDNSFSVGFDPIDAQHKELVKMTNELFQGCKEGGPGACIALEQTIGKALEYAQTHFYTEEKYMKETNYPNLVPHKKEHEDFVAQVRKTLEEFEHGEAEPIILARFLKKWLLNHIALVDKQCAPYFAKLQGKGTAHYL